MKAATPERRNVLFYGIPASCVSWEILLMLLRRDGVYSVFFPVLFALSAGFLLAGILAFFSFRFKNLFLNLFLFIGGAFFSVEYLIRNIYTTYLTPRYLISGAGNAAEGYTAELVRSILLGFPKVLLFLIPFFLAVFHENLEKRRWHRRIHAIYGRVSRRTAKKSSLIAAGSLALFLLLSLLASRGRYRAVYSAQFDYNQATNVFGLITSTRLSIQYALFGNDNVFYSIVSVPETPEKTDSETEQTAEENPAPDSTAELILPGTSGFGFSAFPGAGGLDLEESPAESAAGDESLKESAAEIPQNTETEEPGTEETNTEEQSSEGQETEETEPGAQSTEGQEAEDQKTGEQSSEGQQTEEQKTEEPKEYALHVTDADLSAVENTGNPEIDQLTAYIESLVPAAENEYTGIFKGKNLILICAESYCDAFISEELTPTLWRLSRNGFYFPEYYQPEWGGSTTTGEASFLLGLAPQDGDQTMLESIGNNLYFTMGNQLQRLGYSSIAFHGGEDTFYHRNETHENLGYNQFVANKSGMKEICGNIYPRDTLAFEKTMPLYLDHSPFSVYYMTISGHAPYKKDYAYTQEYYDRVQAAVGDTYSEKTKYYICYQMELEEALKIMVDKLEEAGIAENTVIALVGDHYPYGLGRGEAWGNDRDYINDLIKGDDTVPYEQDRNGLIIWSGCLETSFQDLPKEVNGPVFSLDILPTLSNLFGLPYDSRMLSGRDVFSDAEPLVFWNNLSWVTEYGRYDARHGVYTQEKELPEEEDEASYRKRIDETVRNRILMSRSIIENDYYAKLFGPDDVTQAGEVLWSGSGGK
ncbi:MAG: hypothetical protein E7240_06025 [Lachnospiraceae bacterium]|nr:hypothetical protein [Lachnospiraceae bacterium]